MSNSNPLLTDCPCCADVQIYFPDGRIPWYYRSFPLAMTIGWASAILPMDRGSEIRASVIEAMTRQLIPDFYDIKIPENFNDSNS